MFEKWFIFLVFFYSSQFIYCSREDIHRMFYQRLDTSAACFRRLNGTHQFGCSSPREGAYGVIYLIDNESNLNDFIKNTASDSYMIVLNFSLFRSDIMDKLVSLPSISGILVANSTSSNLPDHYSPEDVCPNSLTTKCDKSKPWNPLGNKFLTTDWPFPIFFVNDENTIETIRNCSLKFNSDLQNSRPLCSLHMKSHMSAAVNSEVCLRRISYIGVYTLKYCDPMGDQNIILPIGNIKTDDKIIIVSARLDTASLFDKIAPGGISAVTSFITLLTTAHIFTSMLPQKDSNVKKIMFILFNGEAHDNIGSSRVVYDIEEGQFNFSNTTLTLSQIVGFIDISQVDSESRFFLHPTVSKGSNLIIDKIKKSGSNFSLNFITSSGDLPPSSLNTFYNKKPDLPGVVVTNFDKQFITKYYHGLMDNSQTLGYKYSNGSLSDIHILQKNLANLSLTLASTLYEMVSNSSFEISSLSNDVAAKIDELLYCYLDSIDCKYMKIIMGDEQTVPVGNPSLPLYVGVQHTLNRITTLTGLLLAYLTSPKIDLNKDKCISTQEYTYIWINGLNKTGGICLNTTLKFTPAVTPAVLIDNYDWSSRKYSTWTESVWNDLVIGMFLKPSRQEEFIILFTGLSTSIISFGIVYWLNKQPLDLIVSPSPTSC